MDNSTGKLVDFETKYNEALNNVKNNNYSLAAKAFEDMSLDFSEINDKTVILSAFSYYKAK